MDGKSLKAFICGKEISLGDYVKVKYTTGDRIEGEVVELWTPDIDKHLQGRVKSGWCFHDRDEILVHKPNKSCLTS